MEKQRTNIRTRGLWSNNGANREDYGETMGRQDYGETLDKHGGLWRNNGQTSGLEDYGETMDKHRGLWRNNGPKKKTRTCIPATSSISNRRCHFWPICHRIIRLGCNFGVSHMVWHSISVYGWMDGWMDECHVMQCPVVLY